MKGIRRWWLLLLIAAAAMWWDCPSAEAWQSSSPECAENQLETSRVDATIRFDQQGKKFVKIYSDMTVVLPPGGWPLASRLTSGKESTKYLTAMRCLLRGSEKSPRMGEWRTHDPTVTAASDGVTVRYSSFAWIKNYETIRLGPWKIEWDRGQTWKVSLPSSTLKDADWRHVEADMGGLKSQDNSKVASSPDQNTLVWENYPPTRIGFEVHLSWQRSLLLSFDKSYWSKVGIGAWWLSASGVIALAALRAQQAQPSSAFSARKDSPVQAVLQWAVLSGAVALMLILLNAQQHISPQKRALIYISAGLALTLVARPWLGGAPLVAPDIGTGEPGSAEGSRRRQVDAVVTVTLPVAAFGLLVVLDPELFGLPPDLVSKEAPSAFGTFGYVLMGLATVWLWLAAMAAWAWRFAREGDLPPAEWTEAWDDAPFRCVAIVSVLLGAVAAGLFGCFCWVEENQWRRTAWLVGQSGEAKHGEHVSRYLAEFSFTDLTWIFTYSWVLAGLALFALLHWRAVKRRTFSSKRARAALGPEGPDVLLIAAVFAFTAGLRGANSAGTSAQYSIWLLLSVGSLLAVLAAGRRWSVLSQVGDNFYTKRLRSKKRRKEIMDKAHECRNINHQSQLLDQGRTASMTWDQVERHQRELRAWMVAGCGRTTPPVHISVLDTALAWGPEGSWWGNAVHAARLAFCFGLPASMALLYLDMRDPWYFMQLSHEPTAVPEAIAGFIAYQTAWAAAGFTLGALWRLLPGRRSPFRAWSLAFAFAVPACLAALLFRFADTDYVTLLLYSMLMAVILTVTSLWTDTTTFSEERQYSPSRLALLVSIYRLRGLTGHIAWLLTQLGAATLIYQHLASR
ncbi:DUF6185 family protein [Streptomyces sp. NPDC046727]|uniref:DUF6185 family protein n=1 Tax=Streptomyces sp. NPDC046727 TaxID=3155373 RepID=UPI0033F16A0C